MVLIPLSLMVEGEEHLSTKMKQQEGMGRTTIVLGGVRESASPAFRYSLG